MVYRSRDAAGQALALLLAEYAGRRDVIVLALPRGGVPVAAQVARQLRVALDVIVVRKLGLPWHPELAAGAIASGGVMVLNPELRAGIADLNDILAPVIERERAELQRREALYRSGRPELKVAGRTVILVDDGIATGATMQAATQALRALGAARIVAAVPVAPRFGIESLVGAVDRFICPHRPADFVAVGQWYEAFPQVSDAQVIALLARGATTAAAETPAVSSPPRH